MKQRMCELNEERDTESKRECMVACIEACFCVVCVGGDGRYVCVCVFVCVCMRVLVWG